MKLRLIVVAAALALAAPVLAAPPTPAGRAYVVEDGSGAVLLRHDDRARVPIASLTKLMTVVVALEHAHPNDLVTVAPAAAAIGESSVHLRAGERISVRDLVKAALIQSANDAAWALAAHVGGGSVERFVGFMNEKARELSLTDTNFARPDGLDAADHYSSARDVTALARIAMLDPLVRRIVAERQATIAGGRIVRTWNDLLATFPGLIGVKTGHTSEAGWSEVAAARGPYATVYATVLGSPSRARRNADLAALLAWGLDRYRAVDAVQAGRVYGRADAPYDLSDLPLVAPRRLVRVVRLEERLVERVAYAAAIDLPVRRGDRVGEVRVYAGRRLLARSPLVAARSVDRPGFGARAEWYAGRTVHHVWSWLT